MGLTVTWNVCVPMLLLDPLSFTFTVMIATPLALVSGAKVRVPVLFGLA